MAAMKSNSIERVIILSGNTPRTWEGGMKVF